MWDHKTLTGAFTWLVELTTSVENITEVSCLLFNLHHRYHCFHLCDLLPTSLLSLISLLKLLYSWVKILRHLITKREREREDASVLQCFTFSYRCLAPKHFYLLTSWSDLAVIEQYLILTIRLYSVLWSGYRPWRQADREADSKGADWQRGRFKGSRLTAVC